MYRNEAGGPSRELRLESVDVEALLVERDPVHVGAEVGEQLERPVVGRRLDEDAPPRHELSGEEREALERAVREHDAVGVDAVAFGDPGPEWPVAARGAVVQDRAAVALDRGAGTVGELRDGKQLRPRNAARERDRLHGPSLGTDPADRPARPAPQVR